MAELELLDSLEYDEIARRHLYSLAELKKLEDIAATHWAELASKGGENLGIPNIADRACIYVTGSLARFEATAGSDLDLFVVDDIGPDSRPLNYMENAHLISSLDQIRLQAGFRPFSRGGEFIHTHSLRNIVSRTGSPDDDATNTFTARILLLLNSVPLLNSAAYNRARTAVLDRYWQTSDTEKREYPIMLMNDIRRWWGVVGLNFEKYNPKVAHDGGRSFVTTPKREIANLKLRYARMLACYSPLLGFLHESKHGGLLRREVEVVLESTPVERLTYIYASTENESAKNLIDAILKAYDRYLEFMGQPEEDLEEFFQSPSRRGTVKEEAYEFHAKTARLIRSIGQDSVLLDYILV